MRWRLITALPSFNVQARSSFSFALKTKILVAYLRKIVYSDSKVQADLTNKVPKSIHKTQSAENQFLLLVK